MSKISVNNENVEELMDSLVLHCYEPKIFNLPC